MSVASTLQSRLPEQIDDDDALYEVVNGQRVELPPTSARAALLTSELYLDLGLFLRGKRLGRAACETMFILDSEIDLRRRPDVAFVSIERWPLDQAIPETGDWKLVPDLAVEVISPNDTFAAVFIKMEEYFQYGVKRVWLVLPEKSRVLVFSSPTEVRIVGETEVLEEPALLPGFRLSLAEFFKNPPAATNA